MTQVSSRKSMENYGAIFGYPVYSLSPPANLDGDDQGPTDTDDAHDEALDPLVNQLDDTRAFTNPDSGYGTASKAATSAGFQPSMKNDTSAELDDVASVLTDNLLLDVPDDVGSAYVKEFVERILQEARHVSDQEIRRSGLVRLLPDLLRAFALRLSFTERSAEGRAVGVFTRQNRE